MEEQMYIIKWQDKKTGAVHGGKMEFSYEDARMMCAELNREFPMIRHFPFPAENTQVQ